MHESDTYYKEILYPLQNGVLSTRAASKAPFYLTGGTALHRNYFGFRYSDDLDLFVNQDAGFDGHVDRALAALRERGYRFDGDAYLRTDQYARVLITANQAALKVDFVNDSAPRFGTMVSGILIPVSTRCATYCRTRSRRYTGWRARTDLLLRSRRHGVRPACRTGNSLFRER